jgi:ubiquinone/menaquinone biosynthesis C-methylase UbiE
MTAETQAEAQRILAEYDRREREIPSDFYALWHPRNLFVHQEHERMVLTCLRRAGLVPLAGRRVLEVGCGHGDWLAVFEGFGARRDDLAGIELGQDRAEHTARRLPGADVRAGDATRLPWEDSSFDVLFQRMMFTSILDPQARRAAAEEMMRVSRRVSAIVWIDFFVNPRNPHVRPLGRADVRSLFPDWRATFWRTTLAPPISRRLVRMSWSLARAVEQLRIFNTFYVALLQSPA